MHALCPIKEIKCPFCGVSKDILHCGLGQKKGKDDGQVNAVHLMTECPRGKG